MLGANTDELRRIASQFATLAERVGGAQTTTMGAVEATDWEGPDRDTFVGSWTGGIDPSLGSLRMSLEHVGAAELPAQADAQDAASSGGGAGGGGARGGNEEAFFGSPGELIERIKTAVERHRHKSTDVDATERHREVDGDVGTEASDMDIYDINQRGIGDCWVLASLAGVARTDPEFLADHVEYDEASNEYIVTIYEDGKPVEVRVDNSYVTKWDDSGYLGVVGDDGEPNFASIYEKALAEHYGGEYDDVWGGDAAVSLETITGEQTATTEITEDVSNAETGAAIERSHDEGKPVMLSTRHDLGDDADMVGAHVYTVTEVRPNGDVVVYNPWGGNPESDMTSEPGLEDGQVVIPQDKLNEYFYEMDTTAS